MNIDDITPGMKVIYRPSFGTGMPIIGTVSDTGTHKGQPVVDFTNSGWAYLHQIDEEYTV